VCDEFAEAHAEVKLSDLTRWEKPGRRRDAVVRARVPQGERCVAEDGADVNVLAGAPLAGLARSIAGRLPVPAVDGVSSAVRHAESMAALRQVRAVKGSVAPPPVKPNRGLPEPIARLLARR
jgi:Asp/Glu/hydantoin racemase